MLGKYYNICHFISLLASTTETLEQPHSGTASIAATQSSDELYETSSESATTKEYQESHKVTFTITVSQAIPRSKSF